MALPAGGQLDDAVGGEIGQGDEVRLAGEGDAVDTSPAALDEAPGRAVAGGEAGAVQELESRNTSLQLGARHLHGGKLGADAAFLEGAARRLGDRRGRGLAVKQFGYLVRQHLFRLVSLGSLEGLEPFDLGARQIGEQAQEAAHVGVLGIAPILPVIVSRKLLFVEPDRAFNRLAHLGAGRGGNQRRGQPKERAPLDPPGQIGAVDDVAPLVRAPHLQDAVVTPKELEEVIGLEHHVAEFEEGERLFALQPEPDAVVGKHAAHREVAAVFAQERNVFEAVEPFGVVDHDGVARAVAEGHESLEHLLDARYVAGDLFLAQELADLVLARGIPDLGRAAPDQHDGLVPGVLQQAQQHDRHQAAHMQAVRRAVEADIGGDGLRRHEGVETFKVGALVQEAALLNGAQEFGAKRRHCQPVLAPVPAQDPGKSDWAI